MNKEIYSKKSLSPLWIIVVFVTFTETVLGIAINFTNAGIQIALTAFVISFPVYISIMFFLFLWKKPQVFYTPGEFKDTENMRTFADVMGKNNIYSENQLADNIQKNIIETMSSEEFKNEIIDLTNKDTSDIRNKLNILLEEQAVETVNRINQENFLTIDLSNYFQIEKLIKLDVNKVQYLGEFAKILLEEINPKMNYEKDLCSIVLISNINGKEIDISYPITKKEKFKPLSSLHIFPGMTLYIDHYIPF
ncbi:MAG: hypothetical protein CL609_23640 [Anaerolineaceae bacterium]|nr:hypothetical protein [Anaerolineaceae bacterium]